MAVNTDHWTKLKVRTLSLRGTKPGDAIDATSCETYGEPMQSKKCVNNTREAIQLPFVAYRDNNRKENSACSESLFTVAIPKSGLQKHWLDNCYQKRAREGFRYWLINRPAPTKFAKSGIGSYKMVLGMGLAPRT